MRKILFFSLLVCSILSLCDTSFAYENEPNSFRGMKWGTPLDSFPTLKHFETVKRYGGIEYYKKKEEVLKLGDVKLFLIKYGFWHNKFYEVEIWTQGEKNWTALKDLVFAQFGEGNKPDKDIEEYIWNGTIANLNLVFNNVEAERRKGIVGLLVGHQEADLAIFKMTSVEIKKQMEEQVKQKAKEGAEDGF